MAHVLFVCLHNAGRSQMSQALFEEAARGRHTAESAGSEADPDGRVHPQVVEVMNEQPVDAVRETRDEIRGRVRRLVEALDGAGLRA